MKVSTKGRYGLRALVDLAVYSSESHVSLVSIAERQNISLNYLEQVFATLRKSGIVKSIKGSQGGYILAEPAKNISVAKVLGILEGDFSIIDETIYVDGQLDPIQEAIKELVWDKINENVGHYLNNTTLEDLVEDYRRRNETMVEMYYI